METFDTNVVVRLMVEDDEEQSRKAEAVWRAALAEGGVLLTKIVLVETVWVLRSAYRFDNQTTARALQRLLAVDGVRIEDERVVRQALTLFEGGPADFADYVILESARQDGALPVITFDRKFAQVDEVEIAQER